MNDWKIELQHLLEMFERESTISLRKISQCFVALGRPFDEKFHQHVLKMLTSRLDSSFNRIVFERYDDENPIEMTLNFEAPIHGNEFDASNSNISIGIVGSLNVSGKRNSLELKVESNREIVDSDDEAADEHSEMQAANDSIGEQLDSNASLELNNDANSRDSEPINADLNDENGMEVLAKGEFKVEIADETVDLPFVEFDPNKANGSSSVENASTSADSLGEQRQLSSSSNTQLKRNNAKLFECNNCKYTSRWKGYFNRHQLIHDDNAPKPFKCQHCNHASRSKSNLHAHQQTHARQKLLGVQRNPKDGLYKCTHCDQQFTKWNFLAVHLVKSHKNNQRLFNCARCMRPFARKIEKQRHEMRCQERRFECYLCKKYVTRHVHSMQEHMRTHSGVKSFECAVCNRCFRQKFHLIRHLESKHCRD